MNVVEPSDTQGRAKMRVITSPDPNVMDLPAIVYSDGMVVSEWQPTAGELEMLLQGGRVRLWQMTGDRPFQQVRLDTVPPDCGMVDRKKKKGRNGDL